MRREDEAAMAVDEADAHVAPGEPETRRPLPVRWIVVFGRFWWDFLVGDTPELFVGTLVLLGLVALLVHEHVDRAVAVVAMPLLALAMLLASVWRARD